MSALEWERCALDKEYERRVGWDGEEKGRDGGMGKGPVFVYDQLSAWRLDPSNFLGQLISSASIKRKGLG